MDRSMPPSIAHNVPGCPAFVPGIRLCGHSGFLLGHRRRIADNANLQNLSPWRKR
jgi:hypothetical protein